MLYIDESYSESEQDINEIVCSEESTDDDAAATETHEIEIAIDKEDYKKFLAAVSGLGKERVCELLLEERENEMGEKTSWVHKAWFCYNKEIVDTITDFISAQKQVTLLLSPHKGYPFVDYLRRHLPRRSVKQYLLDNEYYNERLAKFRAATDFIRENATFENLPRIKELIANTTAENNIIQLLYMIEMLPLEDQEIYWFQAVNLPHARYQNIIEGIISEGAGEEETKIIEIGIMANQLLQKPGSIIKLLTNATYSTNIHLAIEKLNFNLATEFVQWSAQQNRLTEIVHLIDQNEDNIFHKLFTKVDPAIVMVLEEVLRHYSTPIQNALFHKNRQAATPLDLLAKLAGEAKEVYAECYEKLELFLEVDKILPKPEESMAMILSRSMKALYIRQPPNIDIKDEEATSHAKRERSDWVENQRPSKRNYNLL